MFTDIGGLVTAYDVGLVGPVAVSDWRVSALAERLSTLGQDAGCLSGSAPQTEARRRHR